MTLALSLKQIFKVLQANDQKRGRLDRLKKQNNFFVYAFQIT